METCSNLQQLLPQIEKQVDNKSSEIGIKFEMGKESSFIISAASPIKNSILVLQSNFEKNRPPEFSRIVDFFGLGDFVTGFLKGVAKIEIAYINTVFLVHPFKFWSISFGLSLPEFHENILTGFTFRDLLVHIETNDMTKKQWRTMLTATIEKNKKIFRIAIEIPDGRFYGTLQGILEINIDTIVSDFFTGITLEKPTNFPTDFKLSNLEISGDFSTETYTISSDFQGATWSASLGEKQFGIDIKHLSLSYTGKNNPLALTIKGDAKVAGKQCQILYTTPSKLTVSIDNSIDLSEIVNDVLPFKIESPIPPIILSNVQIDMDIKQESFSGSANVSSTDLSSFVPKNLLDAEPFSTLSNFLKKFPLIDPQVSIKKDQNTGFSFSLGAQMKDLGPVMFVAQSDGVAIAIDLPDEWSLSSIDQTLEIFDDIKFKNNLLIISSFESTKSIFGEYSAFENLAKLPETTRQGITFYSDIKLEGGVLENIAKLLPALCEKPIPTSIQIGTKPSFHASLTAELPTEKEGITVIEDVVKILNPSLELDYKDGSFGAGVSGTIELKIDAQPIQVLGKLEVSSLGVVLHAKYLNTLSWEIYGTPIKEISLTEPGVNLGISFITGLPIIGLQSETVRINTFAITNFAVNFNPGDIRQCMFAGTIKGKLTIKELVNTFSNVPITINRELEKFLEDISISGLSLELVPSDVEVGGTHYSKGYRFSGTLEFGTSKNKIQLEIDPDKGFNLDDVLDFSSFFSSLNLIDIDLPEIDFHDIDKVCDDISNVANDILPLASKQLQNAEEDLREKIDCAKTAFETARSEFGKSIEDIQTIVNGLDDKFTDITEITSQVLDNTIHDIDEKAKDLEQKGKNTVHDAADTYNQAASFVEGITDHTITLPRIEW